MKKVFKNKIYGNAIKVIRDNKKLIIEINEAGIIRSAKYNQWKVTNRKKFLNLIADKICSDESNSGYEDTLLIFEFIDNLINDIGESGEECLEFIDI